MLEDASTSASLHRHAPSAPVRFLRSMRLAPGPAVAIALSILALWAASAFILWQSRESELEQARSTADNLARLLDEQTHRIFQTTDLALRHVVERLERVPPPRDDPDIRDYMRMVVAELPQLRALFVIGSDGFLIHDTDYPRTPAVSLADRDYFTVHQHGSQVGLHIGHAVRSRSVGKWFVPVSRRVDKPDGSLAGVAVAAVEPRFFEDFYRELKLGPNDAVALFSLDATLIARTPEMPDIVGRKWPGLDLFQELGHGGRGNFTVRNFSDVESIIGYSRIGDYPLVAVVTLSIPDILAGWRRFVMVTVASAACIALMILVMSFLVMKRRLERAATARAALHLRKMETLGRATGSVAHDFGNVLSVVAASFALIRKRGATDELLNAGEQAVARGRLLTKQLLDFAKRRELNLRPENPNELLRSLEPVIRHAVGLEVRVKLDLSPAEKLCLIDQAQFDAAIMNLVINAAQAMPEGGHVLIATEVRTLRRYKPFAAREYMSVCIKDIGCGIAPADLQQIFEPFFTTKQGRGTGLGLPQVYEFMKRVGGDVVVESEVGQGTTVELLFPCLEETAGGGA